MKMLHLQYFKALAENEHLFRTANELYISPSALSASISRLETIAQASGQCGERFPQ